MIGSVSLFSMAFPPWVSFQIARSRCMDSIRWDYYPRVARTTHARDWLLLLAQLQKAPKTIDAYARGLDDLIDFFTRSNFPLIEAHHGHIATYLNDLHQRVIARPTRRSQQIKCGLANATIQQRLTAARLWYDYLILHNLRRDQVNPVGRGTYRHGNQSLVRPSAPCSHAIRSSPGFQAMTSGITCSPSFCVRNRSAINSWSCSPTRVPYAAAS